MTNIGGGDGDDRLTIAKGGWPCASRALEGATQECRDSVWGGESESYFPTHGRSETE